MVAERPHVALFCSRLWMRRDRIRVRLAFDKLRAHERVERERWQSLQLGGRHTRQLPRQPV